jgi:hypothetical protein
MTEPILRRKDYPLNYPAEIIDIIETMSFSKGKDVAIVGSMSLKSQQYAGDYDMLEQVKGDYKSNATAVKHFVKDFQHIISNLLEMSNVYVGDIKAGMIPEWELVPEQAMIENGRIVGFDAEETKEKLAELMEAGVIDEEEGGEVKKLISPPPSPEKFLELKKTAKFHVVRWTPKDVEAGFTTLRNGRQYTLQEAFTSPAIVKVDVVAYVQQSRYTDFSMIYLFYNRGKILNNVDMSNEVQSIKQDLEYYTLTGNYFKALKRMFSLARKANDTKTVKKLNDILNSDLGRLYSIISDIGTLKYLLEHEGRLSIERIRYELDQFRSRLGNVFTVSTPHKVLEELLRLESLPKTKFGREMLEKVLSDIENVLDSILSKGALGMGKEAGLFPLPSKYRA